MINQFKKHIAVHFPFLEGKKIFLAVSGGVDSMVLWFLFRELKADIAVLHCNFNLRDEESKAETNFVNKMAKEWQTDCFVKYFDTKEYASKNKVSTQIAARELRYEWFAQEIILKKFDYLATAHHANDNLETFLINLSRGTGIEGLMGIPEKNDKIIRPLLPFKREEIENYAREKGIDWKEDSSNISDVYLRNKIRHHVVPSLENISPQFINQFNLTQQFLKDSWSIIQEATKKKYDEVCRESGGDKFFNCSKILELDNPKAYLYFWLKEYGFTAWDDIYNLLNAQSGKKIYSDFYILFKDREELVLSKIETKSNNEQEIIEIAENLEIINFPLKMTFCNICYILKSDNNIIFVDFDKLHFPLIIRKWRSGDVFYPEGMQGKKKLSKYFKDEKYSLLEKERQWLLVSNEQIVWVIGKRADRRFLTNEKTGKTIKIELNQ